MARRRVSINIVFYFESEEEEEEEENVRIIYQPSLSSSNLQYN